MAASGAAQAGVCVRECPASLPCSTPAGLLGLSSLFKSSPVCTVVPRNEPPRLLSSDYTAGIVGCSQNRFEGGQKHL